MKELDPLQLKQEWEKKLKAANLPTEEEMEAEVETPAVFERVEKTPEEVIAEKRGEALTAFDRLMQKFEDLPQKLKEDTLADLKQKQDLGWTKDQVVSRFDQLIEGGLRMMNLDDEEKNPAKPADPYIDSELEKEKDIISDKVEDIIERIEKSVREEQEDSNQNSEETIH